MDAEPDACNSIVDICLPNELNVGAKVALAFKAHWLLRTLASAALYADWLL